jgi:phosphopantetheinyl transferase (holo-ACP synthase)
VSPLGGLHVDVIAVDLRGPTGVVDLAHHRGGFAPERSRPTRPQPAAPPAEVLHAVAALVPDDAADAANRWLTPVEQDGARRRGARGRAAHVVGRVAAKQAIRAFLDDAGFGAIEPDRIRITNDERGCPVVAIRGARVATRRLRVTIAHSSVVAVAAAALRPSGGGRTGTQDEDAVPGLGIDVEPVEPRSSRFERLALSAGEQALAPFPGDDRDTWLTRLWAAKEAAAKATGRGLEGRPKAFAAAAVDGERLLVADRWVTTELVRFAGVDHIVALTDATRTECQWHRS